MLLSYNFHTFFKIISKYFNFLRPETNITRDHKNTFKIITKLLQRYINSYIDVYGMHAFIKDLGVISTILVAFK